MKMVTVSFALRTSYHFLVLTGMLYPVDREFYCPGFTYLLREVSMENRANQAFSGVISCSRHEVTENCAPLGRYAASSGSGVPSGGFGGVQTPPPKFRNFDKVPKIKKILLYEMKFVVPNYSCLQNP
jgi:hypothetical protein